MWRRGRCPTVVPVTPRTSRTRPSAVPGRTDIAIAVAFVLMSLAEVWVNGTVESPVEHVLVTGLAMGALAWRRTFPIAVALVVVGSNILVNPEGEFATLLSLVLAAYTVGAETEPPRSFVGLAVMLLVFIGGIAAVGLVPSDVAAALVFLVGPWSVGSAMRQRSTSAREAVDRAERLEREQELRASVAAAEERTRIARELHDIVSHSISVVTIQTQAVRRRLGPEHAAEARDLAAVEATAREALAEMRRLFGVLRAEGESASLAPQPGLAELGRLVAQARAGDVAVDLVVEGEPYDLPPGIDLAAYRIAQEGLTNALRHADARTVTVQVSYLPTRLEVAVQDDGRGLVDGGDAGGHGLVGVRERAALYGGTVDLTTSAQGGVRLLACLPVRETV